MMNNYGEMLVVRGVISGWQDVRETEILFYKWNPFTRFKKNSLSKAKGKWHGPKRPLRSLLKKANYYQEFYLLRYNSLKMEAIFSLETSDSLVAVQRYNPEDRILHANITFLGRRDIKISRWTWSAGTWPRIRSQWLSCLLCDPGYWFQCPALHPVRAQTNNWGCEGHVIFSASYLKLYRVGILVPATEPGYFVANWWRTPLRHPPKVIRLYFQPASGIHAPVG
jgi:hypothetical protein